MPNEIYHRSNWGESKAEDFGDVYYDHAATNKLYNHSDYYENSDGTDATLKDLNNKASIVLTPTAYSDGSLNTVIPPYQLLSELVTNGDFSDGSTGWTSQSDVTFGDGTVSMDSTSLNAYINQDILTVGSKYRVSITVDALSITDKLDLINGSGIPYKVLEVGTNNFDIIATGNGAFRIRTKDGATSTISSASVKEIQEADFDFSRGSSATRVNEQGLVEDVQILSGELVQNGDFEQIGSELVTNGNFDTDSDWTLTNATISNGVANISTTGALAGIVQSSVTTSGKVYKFSIQITDIETLGEGISLVSGGLTSTILHTFTTVGTHTVYFTATSTTVGIKRKSGATDITIDNVSVKEVGQNWTFGTGWSMGDGVALFDSSGNAGYLTQSGALEINKKYKLTATVNSGIVSLIGAFYDVEQGAQIQTGVDSIFTVKSANGSVLRLYSHPNNGDAEITDISVVEITDDTDLPRIDYTDGTGSLLLEPQSTNLITDSSNGIYGNNPASEILTTAPDGTNTAVRPVPDSNSDRYEYTISGNTYSTDTKVTYSWYRKRISTPDDTQYTGDLYFNGLVNCTQIGVTTEIASNINGYDRFSATFNITDGAQLTRIRAYFAYSIGIGNSSIAYWGHQLEVLDYSTSLIPTSGSTVTRSQDVANNSGNADLFNDSEGVLYAEIAALANDLTRRDISISDGTTSNRVVLRYDNSSNRLRVFVNGTTDSITVTDYTITDTLKIAYKYKVNDYAIWVNGTEAGTNTSSTDIPSGLNQLNFDQANGTNNFYGDVKCVAVFKEALSNDLLERLTGEGYESFRLLAEANNYTII